MMKPAPSVNVRLNVITCERNTRVHPAMSRRRCQLHTASSMRTVFTKRPAAVGGLRFQSQLRPDRVMSNPDVSHEQINRFRGLSTYRGTAVAPLWHRLFGAVRQISRRSLSQSKAFFCHPLKLKATASQDIEKKGRTSVPAVGFGHT